MIRLSFLQQPDAAQIHQITALYRSAGWWGEAGDNPRLVARLVAGSHCFVAAGRDGRIVGMGRAVSDGASDAYIQDVTVDESLRGRGTASRIVRALVRRLRRDGLQWIGLIAEKGSAPLYRPLGFRPMEGAVPMLWEGDPPGQAADRD